MLPQTPSLQCFEAALHGCGSPHGQLVHYIYYGIALGGGEACIGHHQPAERHPVFSEIVDGEGRGGQSQPLGQIACHSTTARLGEPLVECGAAFERCSRGHIAGIQIGILRGHKGLHLTHKAVELLAVVEIGGIELGKTHPEPDMQQNRVLHVGL